MRPGLVFKGEPASRSGRGEETGRWVPLPASRQPVFLPLSPVGRRGPGGKPEQKRLLLLRKRAVPFLLHEGRGSLRKDIGGFAKGVPKR